MRRIFLPLLLVTIACSDDAVPPTDPLPPVPATPHALPVQFSSSVPTGPGAQALQLSLIDGRLILTGRLMYGSAPMSIDAVNAVDYPDSLIVTIDISGGVFAAVDSRMFEAAVDQVGSHAQWVRVRSCCQLFRDTVLFAPLPGRRPSGWADDIPILQ